MTLVSDVLLVVSALTLLAGVSGAAFQLARMPILERPTLGTRGMRRLRALEAGGAFAAVEPATRIMGAWFRHLPLGPVRRTAQLALTRAGEWLGLSDDELFALSALAAMSVAATTALACTWFGWSPIFVPVASSLAATFPWLRVQAVGRNRARSVNRALPGVLELSAMCMSAGLDFPGSLRRVVGSAPDSREPIVEELVQVLQEMELGHTRRSALQRLAARVPTEQVCELASAIVQAEQKGNPLGPVLSIQAQSQRLRRSMAAEQIASDAALMLMGPMTLIFSCVIVLLLAPVAMRLLTGGLVPS